MRVELQFAVRVFCCGREECPLGPANWTEADALRESWIESGAQNANNPFMTGHERHAILVGCPSNECTIRGCCIRPTACRVAEMCTAWKIHSNETNTF